MHPVALVGTGLLAIAGLGFLLCTIQPHRCGMACPHATCAKLSQGDALVVIDVQNDFMESMDLSNESTAMQYEVDEHLVVTDGKTKKTPPGAIAVTGSAGVVGPINEWMAEFSQHGLPIFLSLDWHPEDHCSFCRRGDKRGFCGPLGKNNRQELKAVCEDKQSEVDFNSGKLFQWPDHCVAGPRNFGVRFSPFLMVPHNATVVLKGFDPRLDSYSAWSGAHTAAEWPFWDTPETQQDLDTRPTLGELVHTQNIKRLFVVGLAMDFCVKFTALDALKQGVPQVVLVQSATKPVSELGARTTIAQVEQHGGTVTKGSTQQSPQQVLHDMCLAMHPRRFEFQGWSDIFVGAGAMFVVVFIVMRFSQALQRKPTHNKST